MLLLDNNLSPKIPVKIAAVFPGCIHVITVNLSTASDEEVRNYAKENNLALVTKDADFYHLLNKYGYPPKVVWLRSGNVTTKYIVDLLIKKSTVIKNFLDSSPAGLLELY